jgi:hypothetical protein
MIAFSVFGVLFLVLADYKRYYVHFVVVNPFLCITSHYVHPVSC